MCTEKNRKLSSWMCFLGRNAPVSRGLFVSSASVARPFPFPRTREKGKTRLSVTQEVTSRRAPLLTVTVHSLLGFYKCAFPFVSSVWQVDISWVVVKQVRLSKINCHKCDPSSKGYSASSVGKQENTMFLKRMMKF